VVGEELEKETQGGQTKIFIESEGDAWFMRNHLKKVNSEFPELKLIYKYLSSCFGTDSLNKLFFLEIGCGYGLRTFELANLIPGKGYGIDPSKAAIEFARKGAESLGENHRLSFIRATADELPFGNQVFDLLLYGWCLCYIERELLPVVFNEAKRVLTQSGFLAVLDFDYPLPKSNSYIHDPRCLIYKEDYTGLIRSLGFVHIAKMALFDDGTLGFHPDPEKRIAMNLYQKQTPHSLD